MLALIIRPLSSSYLALLYPWEIEYLYQQAVRESRKKTALSLDSELTTPTHLYNSYPGLGFWTCVFLPTWGQSSIPDHFWLVRFPGLQVPTSPPAWLAQSCCSSSPSLSAGYYPSQSSPSVFTQLSLFGKSAHLGTDKTRIDCDGHTGRHVLLPEPSH